jgi:uncharacterized protein YjbI with pentapeptide repeats
MIQETQERLDQTFDISSEKNRNFLFGFLAAQLYVLVTVGGTTDLDLVLASSSFNLPVVNVTVPLIGFYLIAPFLLLLFHINLLFNLAEHVSLLDKWLKVGGDTALRFPYVINVIACMEHENRKGIRLWVIRRIAIFCIIILPSFILLFTQVRFSDYHSIWITLWHSLLLIIDLLALHLFISRFEIKIFPLNDIVVAWDRLKKVIRIPAKGYRYIIYGCVVLPSLVNIAALSSTLWFTDKVAAIFKVYYQEGGLVQDMSQIPWYIPSLDVHEKSISKIRSVYVNTITPEIRTRHKRIWELYDQVDLQERHFELADFFGASLYNANLSGAYLHSANLDSTELQGANLTLANLQNMNLYRTNLRGANLNEADFQVSYMTGVNLEGASLYNTRVRAGEILASNFQGAHLVNVNLSATDMTVVNFMGADLTSSNFIGSHLGHVNFKGAKLTGADFLGAYMANIELQGADLTGAKLDYCFLVRSELYAAKGIGALETCIGLGNNRTEIVDNYDGTVDDLSKAEVWNDMIGELSASVPHAGKKHSSQQQMEDARNYAISSKVAPVAENMISLKDKEKIEDFKALRRALACKNKLIASRLIPVNQQMQKGKGLILFDKGLEQHLAENCF